jgi:5-hydroxyisourate hydrolase
MIGKLTTHVLDTANGCPAAGMRIDVLRLVSDDLVHLKSCVTNADGRCDEPLLSASSNDGQSLEPSTYMLLFHVGEYFAARQTPGDGKFLDIVPVRFIVADAASNYHEPLLVSPWSYSTYRGS